jgi:hypothetical protein
VSGQTQADCSGTFQAAGLVVPTIYFVRSNGTFASRTTVISEDVTGGLAFEGFDGTGVSRNALIKGRVDGTVTTGNVPGRLVFFTTPVSGSLTERMRIAANGTVQLPSGSPGIKFGTRNANLADYEEGTWTPTYTADTTNPTVTYNVQQGFYTKIGDIVFVYFMIGTDLVTGGSGTLRISGLPFSVNNAGSFPVYGNVVGETRDWASNAPTKVTVGPDSIPATSIFLNNTTVADMDTGSGNRNRLRASLVYRAA